MAQVVVPCALQKLLSGPLCKMNSLVRRVLLRAWQVPARTHIKSPVVSAVVSKGFEFESRNIILHGADTDG